MGWEHVHTINNYYDGPILGVADLAGKPHIFERIFDETNDDWSEEYLLKEIDDELLALVLEDWEIWLRWDKTRRTGSAPTDSHFALPQDRARHQVLKGLIAGRFTAQSHNSKKMRGRFRDIGPGWNGGKVEWY